MAKTEVTHLLFLDLETTGVDENLDEIIEIGCVLTTTGLDCLADCSFPILPTEAGWERLNANEFVREMHEANGLLEELNSLRTEPSEVSDQYRPAAVAKFLIGWLKANGVKSHGVALAGSGVGHFDRRFIKVQMPKLDKFLVHWPIDVGNLRRLYRFSTGEDLAPGANGSKPHRALDDVKLHVIEARAFRDLFRGEHPGTDPERKVR